MCCDAGDVEREFRDSDMNHVIDKYANSITLFITVPPPPPAPRLLPAFPHAPRLPLTNGEGFEDNFVDSGTSQLQKQVEQQNNVGSGGGGGASEGYDIGRDSATRTEDVTSEGNVVGEGGRGGEGGEDNMAPVGSKGCEGFGDNSPEMDIGVEGSGDNEAPEGKKGVEGSGENAPERNKGVEGSGENSPERSTRGEESREEVVVSENSGDGEVKTKRPLQRSKLQ